MDGIQNRVTRLTGVSPTPRRRPSREVLGLLERAAGPLASTALRRVERDYPWFLVLPAQQRSWVGLVAQAGIAAFIAWLGAEGDDEPPVTADVFGTAPRELTASITLSQTLDLIRATVSVVEDEVDGMGSADEAQVLREAVLRYSREIAFAAAQVYAQAAESRGAWDARLEALVVDAVLRGEADDSMP